MIKIRGSGTRPDGYRAAETLEPDFGPVLAQGAGEEFEVAEDFEPFVEVEFYVLFRGGAEEAASPAAAFAVGYRSSDGAAGGEEEEVYVWVYLGVLLDYGFT